MARKITVPPEYRGTPMETRCHNYLMQEIHWLNDRGKYDTGPRWLFVQTQILRYGFVPVAYPRYGYNRSNPEYYLANEHGATWPLSKFEYHYAEMMMERIYG